MNQKKAKRKKKKKDTKSNVSRRKDIMKIIEKINKTQIKTTG